MKPTTAEPTTPAPRGRRVEETRQTLMRSLMELIAEKGYDRTTVEDVLRRADVGRTTFYAHFDNKQDLLLWPVRTFPWCRADDADAVPDVTNLFDHVYQQRHMLELLRGTAALEEATSHLRSYLLSSFEAHARSRCQDSADAEVAVQVVARALTGAVMELFAWWVEAGMPESPATMNSWFDQLGRRMLGM